MTVNENFTMSRGREGLEGFSNFAQRIDVTDDRLWIDYLPAEQIKAFLKLISTVS